MDKVSPFLPRCGACRASVLAKHHLAHQHGNTGHPKVCCITHDTIYCFCDWTCARSGTSWGTVLRLLDMDGGTT